MTIKCSFHMTPACFFFFFRGLMSDDMIPTKQFVT